MSAPLTINYLDHGVMSSIGFAGQQTLALKLNESKKFATVNPEIVTTSRDSQGNFIEKVEVYNLTVAERLTDPKARELAVRGLKNTASSVNFYELNRERALVPDIPSQEMYTQGSKFNLPYRRLRYRIYPCSLPNPADCASFQELASAHFFNFGIYEIGNYSDKVNPIILFGDAEQNAPFSIASTAVMTTYFKKNFIYDDDRGLFNARLTHTYVDSAKFITTLKTRLNPTIYCTAAQIEGGLCEPYMELIWRSSFEKTMIQRRYLTVFDVISEIGGFWDLITYGILLIYFAYNMRSYLRFVRSQLVEGYLDLDRMKSGQQESKRSHAEVRRLKNALTGMKIGDVKSSQNRYWFRKLFNTKPDLKKLVELNFKSEILVRVLAKQPFFEIFVTKLRFEKKREELKKKVVKEEAKKNHQKRSRPQNLFQEQPEKTDQKKEEEREKNKKFKQPKNRSRKRGQEERSSKSSQKRGGRSRSKLKQPQKS